MGEGITSEHFAHSELACPHCGINGMTQAALDMLEQFRARVGKPVIVNSAYRCPEHNAAIGGSKNSQHMLGMAADVRVAGKTPAQLEKLARECSKVFGIGRADHQNYIHIDCRGVLASWCYDESGRECKYYYPVTGGFARTWT